MESRQEVKHPFYIRLTAILLSIVLILFLMEAGRAVLIPLFFSLLIALLLLPVTKFLERRRIPRSLAAVIAILLLLAFITGVGYLLGAQIAEFSKDLPQLGSRLEAWAGNIQRSLATRYGLDVTRQMEYLNRISADVTRYVSLMASALLLAVSGFAIWTLFVFVFVYFILTQRSVFIKFIMAVQPRKS